MKSTTALDANETIFFQKELEYVKTQTYDVKYPDLKARALFPVSFDAGPGAESIEYMSYDQVGIAKIISAYADDLPRSDVKGKPATARIKSLGAAYGYNVQEVRNAQFAGRPLVARKASAAKRSIAQLENRIAFYGDSEHGLYGLLNNPNVTRSIVPVGAGGFTTWDKKTPDEIIADMNSAANFVVESTNGVEVPDTLLLPLRQYNHVNGLVRSAQSDKTVLAYFKENSGFIKNVEWIPELKGAGPTGGNVMIAYRKSPEVLTLEIPQDFEQFDEQLRGLEYVVPCHERIGGLIIYYPLAVNIIEGI